MYICVAASKQNGSSKRDENQSAQYRHHRSTEKFRSEKNRVMCTLEKWEMRCYNLYVVHIAVLGSAAISFARSRCVGSTQTQLHHRCRCVQSRSESLALIFEHIHTFFRSILNGETATKYTCIWTIFSFFAWNQSSCTHTCSHLPAPLVRTGAGHLYWFDACRHPYGVEWNRWNSDWAMKRDDISEQHIHSEMRHKRTGVHCSRFRFVVDV